jgi:acetyl esterase/lipase
MAAAADESKPPIGNDDNDGTYWMERVALELQPVARTMDPKMTFNTPEIVSAFHAMLCTPGPAGPGVVMKEVEGIGTYFIPICPGAESSCAKPTATFAVLWIHGGGRIMGSSNGAGIVVFCSKLVNLLGVPVFSVDHRYTFPEALDDVCKAYHWLLDDLKSAKAGRDIPSEVRIALGGESAGAGLSAELCQRLLDESNGVSPVCQILIYPMLDDRTSVNDSLSKLPPHLVWNNKSNLYAWSSYLGQNHKPGDETLPAYASASRREDLANLPPAYVQVGSIDLFRDECEVYAQRLKDHGVETEFVEIDGAFHGHMVIANDEEPILKAWERIGAFGKKYLSD